MTPSSVADFYDRLAPFYHLIFPDWEASIARQAAQLDVVIRVRTGGGARTVLDVACGIGTQSLGLAALGHDVTASDLSAIAVERARREAERRGLHISFSVADMRAAHEHHGRTFDIVLCADNSLPHLLADGEILIALKQLFACTRPGGACILSVRDYAAMPRVAEVQHYGTREEDGARWILLQHRAFDGDRYDLTFYVVEDRGGDEAATRVLRSRYYAISTKRLMELMREAGFVEVERLDGAFYQPLLVGTSAG
ncbi:class I SAM-dependent methyltransferase [Longimicrobium sp.]|uniref:class I SAM-dependent methyltransferase n=1 Tax=Longimicrobium sp. TaxID=2029185 RepID=UPI002BB49117|nr:class I SAM-dependent methyltransferase [Longimicrobium sp.]HSU16361.1 class I SAM-dependent methyltransferase [Longimicrobium sp.]